MNNKRRSRRRSQSWSSSVVGTHASRGRGAHAAGRPSGRSSARRGATPNLTGRTAEVRQMGLNTRSVDERTAARHKVGQSRTENFMRRRNRMTYVMVALVAVIVLAIAFGLGSCVFKNSLSSSMALNDEKASSALVAAEKDKPYYVLVAGISGSGKNEQATFLTVLRVDEAGKKVSLLNVPTNIAASFNNSSSTMLADAPVEGDEGQLISKVSSLIEADISHYVRITENDFASLVDAMGGLSLNVKERVDDPTAGSIVLYAGDQTLNGEQAAFYVKANNYSEGPSVRCTVQNEVLMAMISKMGEKSGVDSVLSADTLSSKMKTDMNYDAISSLIALYGQSEVKSGAIPGSNAVVNDETFYSVGTSSWNSVRDQFKNGEDMVGITTDTSGVDKATLSVIVLNGTGLDGYGAQAASKLTAAGYTIKETGNAASAVYNETLVIYRADKDKAAAEAIVQDLGIGRAVSAGVHYTLTTDIQVVVGKDWNPIA